MTYAEHIAPFLRAAAGDQGALPEREHHDGNTEPMQVDLPAETPFSDDFTEEPTEAGLRARPTAPEFERRGGLQRHRRVRPRAVEAAMSNHHIAERLHDLHAVADTFADRLSELATLLQDDAEQAEITNLLTAALGGMEAVEALLAVAKERARR